MTLSTNEISTSTGEAPQPFYISKERALRLEDIGQPDYLTDPVDVAVRLVYSPDGQTFEIDIDAFGKYKRDGMGAITDWGSAFRVGDMLKQLGFEDLDMNDDGTIPHHVFDEVPGRAFHVLRYVAGRKEETNRLVYYTFNRITGSAEHCSFYDTDEDATDRLKTVFDNQVEGGWVKSYKPHLLESNNRSPSSGPNTGTTGDPANRAAPETPTSQAEEFEPDDELPF